MSANTIAAIEGLIDSHPNLMPILTESREDNFGEVLPHLVLGDIMQWLASHVRTDARTCRSVLDWMERQYDRSPEDVQELFVVSGVEMIPDPGEAGSELRAFLGPVLRGFDPWGSGPEYLR